MEPNIINENHDKELNFSVQEIKQVTNEYPTPFHFYNGDKIIENGKLLSESFKKHFPQYKNYFAVKATPNPSILKILKESVGMGVDCSSLAELLLSERCGFTGSDIMFTSNNTKSEEYIKAYQLGAIINLDDITQIEYLYKSLNNVMPEFISFRYNPGPLKTGNDIIGNPKDAKFGLTSEDLPIAYKKAKELGCKRFGLHCMVASNELDISYFEETARLLFKTVTTLSAECGIQFEQVNLGGGIGIPYRPNQTSVNYNELTGAIANAYKELILDAGLNQVNVVTECGRVITGPYGVLVTKAIHSKSTYKQFIGVDSCMADLMRPGMYGAYHHITVLEPKHPQGETMKYDLVGSLCENNDKFCIDRTLPKITTGDTIVIHDTGAHGHSMGFNYNGKLRSAEYLLLNNNIKCIRRAETYDDLFSTLSGF